MRIKGLDFLRGIAIFGVLCRHVEMDFFLSRPGGYGVDLFFVLSGFLVSGLLFSDYKKNGNVSIGRFLLRRGFKIYPSFYFFIAGSVSFYALVYSAFFPPTAILSEVFFLQSYVKPMWSHTWSLAVEEHFYFLLALLVFAVIKYRWLENRKSMMILFCTLILLPFLLRVQYVYSGTFNGEPFYQSHLRMDGLFTGALLGYPWQFNRPLIDKIYQYKRILFVCAVILVLPAFLLPVNHPFMLTVGFNLLHLAFASAVLLAIHESGEKILFGKFLSVPSGVLRIIGIYSYTIYLWHIPVQNVLLRYFADLKLETLLYFIASIATGIIVSLLIEKPMLKLRDRYFPRN
jgi:peptidoglycan/LPS O-acetylase OafA/YrhL